MDTFDGNSYTDWHQMVRDIRSWLNERLEDKSCDTATLIMGSTICTLHRYRFGAYLSAIDEIIGTFDPPGGMLDGPPPNLS